MGIGNKRLTTRWVCFNDQAWESSGWGGMGWVGNIPTTFIQLTVAGSIFNLQKQCVGYNKQKLQSYPLFLQYNGQHL